MVLDTAAGILAVEAYHAGAIRTLLYQRKDQVAAAGLSVEQVTKTISDLRAKVGGGKDQGITVGGKANIVVADHNGVAFGRTPLRFWPSCAWAVGARAASSPKA